MDLSKPCVSCGGTNFYVTEKNGKPYRRCRACASKRTAARARELRRIKLEKEMQATYIDGVKPCGKCGSIDFYYYNNPNRKRNRRCRSCHRKWANAFLKVNGRPSQIGKYALRPKSDIRRYHLKFVYGLTEQEYFAMIESQGNVCAVCSQEFKGTPHVDHDHATGKVRGLLCRKCNHGLGNFRDDADVLEKAAKYIRHHKESGE